MGALYLNAGISAVEAFVHPLLRQAAGEILLSNKDLDPKSLLQEWLQANGFKPPEYRTVAARGPDHAKVFEVEVVVNGEVYGRGEGYSKQQAAKQAARAALKKLGLDILK